MEGILGRENEERKREKETALFGGREDTRKIVRTCVWGKLDVDAELGLADSCLYACLPSILS